ncbi:MAG: hypothetical protein OXF72_08685 [Gammaproteobacteria bacterium]|nr:hypothetical protein [Gammaproteobacteria bacterium]MCY4199371.1 hypothetical protein [Gammaproteobacteria bacterium]
MSFVLDADASYRCLALRASAPVARLAIQAEGLHIITDVVSEIQ